MHDPKLLVRRKRGKWQVYSQKFMLNRSNIFILDTLFPFGLEPTNWFTWNLAWNPPVSPCRTCNLRTDCPYSYSKWVAPELSERQKLTNEGRIRDRTRDLWIDSPRLSPLRHRDWPNRAYNTKLEISLSWKSSRLVIVLGNPSTYKKKLKSE